MNYPTLEEVERASHYQLCAWHRFLHSPGAQAVGSPEFYDVMIREARIQDVIETRLKDNGGFTPEISKSLGWEAR